MLLSLLFASSYALVIGNNQGGAGQKPLRYAEDDATAMAALLVELGHYDHEHVDLALAPNKATVNGKIAALQKVLENDRQRGEQASLFFYYSGHARANAINLGREEVSIAELREALVGLPSTLTIAVLDACQSGAFSRIKGAEPTADFSFNTVNKLNGLVVMASSSGTELSQESDTLKASYFTHNLLTAMRGAGDNDADGQVTLHEAYRYAYGQTLLDTTPTAIGGQHPTLETSLSGKGELPLSYPREASAQLVLPAAMEGQVVVSKGQSVLAEIQKAVGEAMTLGLAPGAYTARVRQSAASRECEVALTAGQQTAIDLAACTRLDATPIRSKGEQRAVTPWGLELGAGPGFSLWGIGTISAGGGINPDRVADFSTALHGREYVFRASFAALRSFADVSELGRHFALGLSVQNHEYAQGAEESGLYQRFEQTSLSADVFARVQWPLLEEVLLPYAQLGVGGVLHIVSTEGNDGTKVQRIGAFLITPGIGLQVMPWTHFGVFAQANLWFTTRVFVPWYKNDKYFAMSGTFGLRAAF